MERSTRRTNHLIPRCITLIACALVTLASSGCRHNIEVRTVAAPGVTFAGRTTFRILTPRYSGTNPLAANDPMVENSITYEALRDEIRRAFESKGYRHSPDRADLDVAFYATARRVVDYVVWGYGHTWDGFPVPAVEPVEYEEGSVVIDVIDPASQRLMWRGQAAAPVDSDPDKYVETLRRAVDAIVARFPAAS